MTEPPPPPSLLPRPSPVTPAEAEAVLEQLAAVFGALPSPAAAGDAPQASRPADLTHRRETEVPSVHEMERTLVEQIPAVVFMARLDRGFSDAYVSPQIEQTLGYSQEEWLEDPIRWYHRIHPGDRQGWSGEAAEMLTSGKPLRSDYRGLAGEGPVV